MLIRLLAVTFFVVGLAGFVAPFWIGSLTGVETVELPLAEIEDVSVANDGRIYFALMHLGRVQVYATDGTFIRNFSVRNSGGAFCLEIVESRLIVSVARRDEADEFDLDGKLVHGERPINEDQYRDACRNEASIRALDQALDAVTVKFTDGRSLRIERKLWHYLALGPFWSWFMFVIGMFLLPEWRRGVFRQLKLNRQ